MGLISLLLTLHEGYSQKPVISHFTDLDGLPSTTLYDMLQDEDGTLWIATDNGIVQYNGIGFKNYGLEEGLNDNSIVHIYKDKQGRIWGLGYNGTLSCVENEKVIRVKKWNELINQNLVGYIDKMYIDSLNRLWLAERNGGVFYIDREDRFNTRFEIVSMEDSLRLFIKDFNGRTFISLINDSFAPSMKDNRVIRSDDEYYLKMDQHKNVLHRNVIKIGEEEYLISYRTTLSHIKDGKEVRLSVFDKRIIDLMQDNDGKVWISVNAGGIYLYDPETFRITKTDLFKNLTVSRIVHDREGTYWFSTTRDGLYCIRSFDLEVIENREGESRFKVLSISGGDDKLFFTTYDQKLYSIDLNKRDLVADQIYIEVVTDLLFDVEYVDDGRIWLTGTEYRAYHSDGKPALKKDVATGLQIMELKDGRLLFTKQTSLQILERNGDEGPISELLNDRILTVFEDLDNNIIVGTLDGIYLYNENHFSRPESFPHLNNIRISSLNQLGDLIVAGTSSDGLFLFNSDTMTVVEDNLPGGIGRINCIVPEGDSLLWVGTHSGLVKYIRQGSGSLDFRQVRYSRSDGLPSDRINCLFLYHNILWVGTDFGMVAFQNRMKEKTQSPPAIRLKSIEVNNSLVPPGDTIIFPPDQNNLRFTFEGISLKGQENVNFRFMLAGHDNQIIFTNDNFVNYSNLRSGEYVFYVNAGDNSGLWNQEPHSTVIKIEKKITEKVWFYIVIVLVGLIIVAVVIKLILVNQKRRNRLNQDLLEMQQRLLRTQMNPHFIFNSLLAIQNFIYRNEASKAGKYLSRFAKLIRLILNSSRKEFITLEDEIEFLNIYLELQKLRFKRRFEYRFEVDENIRTEQVYIPPMLAQPFIENAIEHGLKEISHEGVIIVRFYYENKDLVFEVEDNGIGIFQSERNKEISKLDYESLGQQITYDRLKLLSQTKKEVSYKVEELKDENGAIQGTRVQFRINIG